MNENQKWVDANSAKMSTFGFNQSAQMLAKFAKSQAAGTLHIDHNLGRSFFTGVRAGHRPAAAALLEDAGRLGNSAAFAELAAWLLRGDVIPRDVSRARSILR